MISQRAAGIRKVAFVSAALLLTGSFQPQAASQGQGQGRGGPPPEVREAEKFDTSPQLRAMPPVPRRAIEAVRKPPRRLPNRLPDRKIAGDAAVQQSAPVAALATIAANFDGVGAIDGVLPPDTNGDVGPNHYVQTVNLSFAIWNKSGTLLYGPVDVMTLWQGFGGACASNNDGDPVVLYDHLANRWMISQFALPSFPNGPFYQCIAVSQTADPLGAYHRYAFVVSNTKLNDYPKFGVWSDGYYMSINQFTCNVITCNWAGAGAVVFERDKMLNGDPGARMVYFDLLSRDPNLGGMLPSDLDGPAPPAGTPNTFVQVDDDAWGYSGDQLQLWAFQTNWGNPAASTFTFQQALGTSAFDSNMCGYARNCIPQSGTATKVDAMSDRLMYRLQFRTFGSQQTLITSHTVDASGADRAGIRWYELNNFGSGWSITQQATYSPDANHRWMSSAAMNGAGHIALGFSVSSGTMFPTIRATGRLPGDPAGSMTQGETTLIAGAGSQSHSSGRWGDYSMMAVDPADDCTFWYTQEYYSANSSASWKTRVSSFKLANCGGGGGNTAPTVDIVNPASGSTVSGTVPIQIAASDAENAAGTLTVEWNVDGGGWQTASYNAASQRYEASWNTTSVGDGGHTINARATDSGALSATDSNAVSVDNVPDPPPATMHGGDLDGFGTNNQGGSWTASVTITVHDASHAPLVGATIIGTWSNGAAGSAQCTTDSSGQCMVTEPGIPKKSSRVTFNLVNITQTGKTYLSSANHDPDGSSNGTTLIVSR